MIKRQKSVARGKFTVLPTPNPKWQNIVAPHTALKPTLSPVFQCITAYLVQLVSFCGPVVGLW